MSELHYETLTSVAARIKGGELSATKVTETMLTRIARLDPGLHSYARVLADSALASAHRLDRERAEGHPMQPLHGVPVAVKDLLYTRGVPTASGTTVMANFIPDQDATVVARLKQAGAVIVGKTQLTEGAYGAHHPDVQAPVNPWSADVWPGVSSSGSGVAVAAGMAYGALGSDTGGSIRFPCACCGLVGIKPTYGRVSRFGAFPLAESLDHIGPMTRTVADAALLLQVLAGADPHDSTSLPDPVPKYGAMAADHLSGLKLGVDWDYVSTGVDETVVATVREAVSILADLGAQVVDVTMPASLQALVHGWVVTCGVECARAHARWYDGNKRAYGPVLAGLIESGLAASAADYEMMETLRVQFRRALDVLLQDVDVLIAPCMPTPPPPLEVMNSAVEREEERAEFITFTAPFDYSGHPTITLPAGLDTQGLPRAFQLIGRWLGEPTLIRCGFAFESATGFDRHPVA